MFFQSKSGPRLFEANRQFGQIVYGKSGRIGDLPYMHGAKFKFSGYMTVSGLCMHDFCARASAPWKTFLLFTEIPAEKMLQMQGWVDKI